MLSSERRSAGLNALDALEKERQGGWYEALSTTDESGGSSRGASLYFFATTAVEALASLRRRLDALDDGGWSDWVDSANELHKNIADVSGYRSEWGLLGVLSSAAASTAADVGAGVKKLGQGAELGAGLFTFLLLGCVAWKVLK